MKVQIIYTSRSGCTEKVARAIYEGLPQTNKSIHNWKDGVPALDGDILLLGYWGISGGPCDEFKAFLASVEGKTVGVFCTLGYYADSAHARDTLNCGLELLKAHNQIIGGYVCNGAVASSLKKGQGFSEDQIPTEQKEIRWEITASHPTRAECDLAAERFRERIYLYERCHQLHIPFSSIL